MEEKLKNLKLKNQPNLISKSKEAEIILDKNVLQDI